MAGQRPLGRPHGAGVPPRGVRGRHPRAAHRVAVALATATCLLLTGLVAVASPAPARAAEGDFTIYDGATTVPVLVDASYHGGDHAARDLRQVRRAVQDLRQDVAMVTGAIDASQVQATFVDDAASQEARLAGADQSRVPALLTDVGDRRTAIIVGVVGRSELVDGIIAAGKFDEAAGIAGEWEAHAVKRVDEPLPGVDSALVVAGSDARGAVYGVYSISEEIGVSPWYWYSDVPVEQRDRVVVDGSPRVDDGPDVQYRGIFINDEERTVDWARLKFPTGDGTPEVGYYRHVFEMMLRLRLNTLWPAMHEGTTSFNAVTDTGTHDAGTPVNAEEAAEYGVIMSTSHAELMLRNNVDEWRPFYERNKEALGIEGSDYASAFNYSVNKPAIIQYWRERLVANEEFESIVALGIRGVHDGAPAFTAGNRYGFASVVEMVADAIAEQRRLIAELHGSADAVPQVFIPYKEMADLYNSGLKAHIPDDVILMWAEDNHGQLRQVPTESEAARSGGNGVYYHSSYWGSPKSYLWLNSTPMQLMVEQLHRAWNTGAGRYWVLNVGDIKPGEMTTELFAKLAWDVEGYDDANLESRFLVEQAERDFGLTGDDAAELADALSRFSVLQGTKKAEFWGTSNTSGVHSAGFQGSYAFPFSATSDGDELQRYIDEANELVDVVEDIWTDLDERHRSAFYQQVVHRVRGYRSMAEQIGYYWKNQLYAAQGRYGSAKAYALLSMEARERIRSDEEYWDTLSDGKWDEAIGHSHPITYYGGVNEGIVMLTDDRYARATPVEGVGANAEGRTTPGSGVLRFHSAAPTAERFFDVFARSSAAEEWVAETDASWIVLSERSGTTSTEQRVTVTVDWAALEESGTGTITVYNAENGSRTGGPVATFTVAAERSPVELGEQRGHLEANGYVAVEAEHFAQSVPGEDGSEWRRLEDVAQRGAVMKAFPETAPRVDSGFAATAQLRYRVHFTSTGQFTGTFYRLPTLNEGTNDDGTVRSSRTAIGLDGNVPTSANLRGCAQTSCGAAWANNTMRQIEPLTFTITVPTPGWHELVVYRSDASIVFDRIVVETVPGAVGDGLVGPVESPNTIAEGDAVQVARVAPVPEKVASYEMLAPSTLAVGEARRLPELGTVVAAESQNPTAATVALDDGELTLTGRRPGTTEITVTRADGMFASFSVTVESAAEGKLGAYQERDGVVVIDAVDALEQSAYARAVDSNNGTHTWALTQNGLQVVPVGTSAAQAHWLATSAAQGAALLAAGPQQRVNGSLAAGTPPRLEFTVDIETGGTYYLFVNSSHPNVNADSYHVAVDGRWRYHSSKGGSEIGAETWYGSTGVSGAALALEPGRHVVSVWAREAGVHLNQVALTTSTSPAFSGFLDPSGREDLAPRGELSASVSSPHDAPSFPVSLSFDQDVTGLELDDLVVTGGTASGLVGSGRSYTFTVTADGDGEVSVALPADAVVGADGVGNRAVEPLTVTVEVPGADPGIEVAAQTRCVAGRVVEVVRVASTAGTPLEVTVTSAYGSRTTTVDPDRAASLTFSTRLASVGAGTVSVSGAEGTTVGADYAARTCG
jgi:hypothetical protein